MGNIFDGAVAALVAALLSVIGLVATKESKISEFRQAWIDALRTELAEFSAQIALLAAELDRRAKAGEALDYANLPATVVAPLFAVAARIRLRLNPAEADAAKILALMDELRDLTVGDATFDYAMISQRRQALVAASQPLLKAEWSRVKRGEVVYRVLLGALTIGLVIAAVVLVSASV